MSFTALTLCRPRVMAYPSFKGEPSAATMAFLQVVLWPEDIPLGQWADNDNEPRA